MNSVRLALEDVSVLFLINLVRQPRALCTLEAWRRLRGPAMAVQVIPKVKPRVQSETRI